MHFPFLRTRKPNGPGPTDARLRKLQRLGEALFDIRTKDVPRRQGEPQHTPAHLWAARLVSHRDSYRARPRAKWRMDICADNWATHSRPMAPKRWRFGK